MEKTFVRLDSDPVEQDSAGSGERLTNGLPLSRRSFTCHPSSKAGEPHFWCKHRVQPKFEATARELHEDASGQDGAAEVSLDSTYPRSPITSYAATLLHLDSKTAIERLDALKSSIDYLPITTAAMLKAAEFWADARRRGLPTAPEAALDADVILAAQAALLTGRRETERRIGGDRQRGPLGPIRYRATLAGYSLNMKQHSDPGALGYSETEVTRLRDQRIV